MKIFLRGKTIHLSDQPSAPDEITDTIVVFKSRKQLKKAFLEFAGNERKVNLFIYSEPVESGASFPWESWEFTTSAIPGPDAMSSFFSLFKIIEAAGGVVKNGRGEILFIFRRGKWDLPKGKISVIRSINADPQIRQTDETLTELNATGNKTKTKIKEPYDRAAIREVMEETGLHDIRIIRELGHTYHIYMQRGKWILKPTLWFEMLVPDNQVLIPEEKEDITEVRWFTREEMKMISENTYPAIRELIFITLPLADQPEI
jgi:8-oxo-dGTP pyrophosphatase MutT (NUDIX family)